MKPSLPRRTPPGLLLLAALAAALVLPISHAADTVTTGRTLELPTLTVTESAGLPPVENWSHGQITGFEVLSNASETETRRLLADFQKFQQAVRLIWPAPPKPVAAATLILCGKRNQFDAFLPTGAGTDDALVPSVFLRNREQIAIVVDIQADLVAISDPITLANTGAASVDYQVDHYRQLYREYVHYLLSQGETRQPAWLEEGLAQIIMDIELKRRTLIFGKIDTNRGDSTGGSPLEADADDASVASAIVGEQPFNVVLEHRPLLPFDRFLTITNDAPEARSPLGNNLWAKQAYAFVHFCLFGENLRHREALTTFVSRLAREPLSEALFKDCFKVGYKDMEKQLRSYLRYTKHKYQQYDFKDADYQTADAIKLETAGPDQIGLIKGDALRLAGHPVLAQTEYRGAYLRGSRDPALLAGLAAIQSDAALALKFSEEAVKADTNRPSAYVALARIRLADFKADPGPDGRLTGIQLAAVLTPLFKARSHPPRLPDTYRTIAEAWSLSSVAPKPENLTVLEEGVRQFPRDIDLVCRTAALYLQIGNIPTARAITQVGQRFVVDPADRVRLDALVATLPPAVN